ncbi:MAG TPA: MFS transporter [Tenuifilaceae bacterium]|nr:MFS transporter [Tenuifilaceae bacterium]HPI45933.1 MFS transporter [Tenuifilaceae bacterium]HPN21941.1 MFS transporter [Tenuifilaceae bacterium]
MFRYLDINSYFQKVGFAFRALKSPNFKLFFYGQIVSLLGTFIQNLALGWLIYRLTDSPFLLGVIGFAGQIPSLVLTPFAGVFADRLNRRKVLITTQAISMVMAFLLTFLFFTDRIEIWHIIAISIVNGMSLAFDTPFRHAFLVEMVGNKDLLPNAIALNSTLINSARFVGPTVGGFLIAWFGEGYCFLINGVSFLAVIGSLMAMKVIPLNKGKHRGSIMFEMVEGFKYSFNFKPIRYLILFVVAMGFFGLPFQVFLPVFAKDILHGDSQMLGYLTGSMGAGALLGAFYLASQKGVSGIPKSILYTSFAASFGLIAFSLSNNPILSIILIFFTGFGMIAQFAATNTLLQHIVDDDKRGRVVALYGMSFMGITPLGSLLLGSISPWVGVQITLVASGVFCLLAALIYAKRLPIIRKEVSEN